MIGGRAGRVTAPPEQPGVSPILAGLTCRCPACGKGRLFAGYLALAPACEVCGLDYTHADSGDGPAVFVILILGFAAVGAALVVEVAFRPPYWLHVVLWLPAILGGSLGLLRPFKAILVALQFKHKATQDIDIG